VPLDEDLIPMICTPAEIAWMQQAPVTPPSGWPKVIFSAKESIHKCVWPLWGRNLDFLDVTLTLDAARGRFRAGPAVPAAADVDLPRISGRMTVDGPHVFTSAFVDVISVTEPH
jgi:4'-phosphopantetheinyl transferase EntD